MHPNNAVVGEFLTVPKTDCRQLSANYYHFVTGELGRCGALNDVTDDLPTNTCPRDSHSDDDEDGTTLHILCSSQEVDSIVCGGREGWIIVPRGL